MVDGHHGLRLRGTRHLVYLRRWKRARVAGAWIQGGQRREAELESWAGPGLPGPWKGFSDIYLKVSRRPLGSYWRTGLWHTIRCVFLGESALQGPS